MKCIVTRTNGKVTQIWQGNDPEDAAWWYFIRGMSMDVHWKNEGEKLNSPKIFKDRATANWYLQKRLQILRKKETGWTYEIREVEG